MNDWEAQGPQHNGKQKSPYPSRRMDQLTCLTSLTASFYISESVVMEQIIIEKYI